MTSFRRRLDVVYRHFSNLVRPLIRADKLFWQSRTNLFPLKLVRTIIYLFLIFL